MFSMKKKIVEIKKIIEKKFIRFQGEDLKKIKFVLQIMK